MKKSIDKLTEPGKGRLASILDFILFLCTPPGRRYAMRLLRKRSAANKIDYHEWITAHLKVRQQTGTQSSPLGDRIKTIMLTADIADVSSVIATGSASAYYLFVENGTIPTPDCMQLLTQHLYNHPQSDIVYSDEDEVKDGIYSAPYFKPGWSPDTLLTRNYIGNTFLISRRLFEQCGGIKAAYGTSAMYDLLLRASEHTTAIYHIPEVLFHKTYKAHEPSTVAVIEDTLNRRSTPAVVTPLDGLPGCCHVNYRVRSTEKVSIIMPTKDQASLLKKAIDSILNKTTYPDYEIIILNNNSTSKEFFDLAEQYQKQYSNILRFTDASFPFNFSRLMNLGAAESSGAYILMCNNDVEVIHGDWMERMVGYAQLSHIGAVGAKLLYPDSTVQHAGVALDVNEGDVGHVFTGAAANDAGYHGGLAVATNYSAVTAACLMCRKELYLHAGGMDEQLAIEYNDIDLCLNFLKAGRYNVLLPEVTLYHHESATRAHPFRSRASWRQHERELSIFKAKWPGLADNDPFFDKNILRIKNL